ncbi:MAG: S8 family serine peptidase [Microscillaceae bacterium]|nr:S8 family serine peptidase [Microscillaceae bacterium]
MTALLHHEFCQQGRTTRDRGLFISKITFFLMLWILFGQNTIAQINSPKNKILEATNVTMLRGMSNAYKQTALDQKNEAEKIARQNGWEIRKVLTDGSVIELIKIDENGQPLYYKTDNLEAAQTLSTNRLWSGGDLGLNLSGFGLSHKIDNIFYARLGVWDGGAVRKTHNEFKNGDNLVVQRDNVSTLNDHATHVSGTLVGRGANPSAQGMAWRAQLDAHDWNSDESEMALAASRGMLISNHSYGFIAGWRSSGGSWLWYGDQSVSVVEDYKFGFYDGTSEQWDNIAYNAPYYLIVKSAGNDRGEGVGTSPITAEKDGGSDGYDCISLNGNAKNILTVGAVNPITSYNGPSSVVVASFSSWGPTDDGRIKPDICGAGVGIFSSVANSDDAYSYYSGTSMATPNVSGSLLLLQEHYENENGNGNFMRSATLKALVIHTADETGSFAGPDYKFGWGLMNTARAAELISKNAQQNGQLISERELNNGDIYSQSFTPTGNQPLIFTISWTDPAGKSPLKSLNPVDLMLINDLDMRISDGTNTYLPYILDPSNPDAPAFTGDNFRDNVEKIYIANPNPNKVYTLTITHKKTLASGLQNFSLIVSGVEPPSVFNNDLGVVQISGFNALGCNQRIQPIVLLKNFGNTPIHSFELKYQVNEETLQSFSWIGQLEPKNSIEITLPEIDFPEGLAQQFSVITLNPNGINDENPSNDSKIKEFDVLSTIQNFPYLESFENGAAGWQSGGSINDWQLGKPAKEFIKAASNGQNAWVTNLTGNYNSNQDSYLESPLMNMSELGTATLTLDIFRRTEQHWDGVQLQASTDCGKTWMPVGGYGSGNNWYNSNAAQLPFNDFGDIAWSGEVDNNWVTASHPIDQLAGHSSVKFRFVFRSDGSVTREGFAMDNFRISGTKKADQTITFAALPNVTYGVAPIQIQATVSSGLPVSFVSSDNTIAQIINGVLTIKQAGQVTITASQSGNQSFKAAPSVSQTLTIQKASLIVKAENKTRYFQEINPPLTLQYQGFVNNDNASLLDQEPFLTTTAEINSPVGVYPITLSGGQDKSYNFIFENGTLDILPATITQLLLVDADQDEIITELKNNESISLYNLANRKLSILAITRPQLIGKVRFQLSGPLNVIKTETIAPYTLFGDAGEGQYDGVVFSAGAYTIQATPFAKKEDNTSTGQINTINFNLIDLGPLEVSRINLIDADTDQIIQEINDGDIIQIPNLSQRKLTIQVTTNPALVGSINLALKGPITQTKAENLAPYSLFGDTNGPDYTGVVFPLGQYQFTGSPYAAKNLGGFKGTEKTVNFEIKEAQLITVAKLTLIDADNDREITVLSEGQIIQLDNLDTRTLSILATTSPAVIGSIKFELIGAVSHTQSESIAPFTLFGDKAGPDYLGRVLSPGQYTILATPYSEAGLKGKADIPLRINFELSGEASPLQVTNLNLIDADQDRPVLIISEGMIIDMNTINNTRVSIQANTSALVGSVQMDLNGPSQQTRVENIKPFSLFGDKNGLDYTGTYFCPGFYNITITPYELPNLGGKIGDKKTISFQVINSLVIPNLTLLNASTDKPIGLLGNNSSYNLAEIGSELSILANSSCAKSVKFVLYNAQGEVIHTKIENQAPFTLFGDHLGDYFSWIPIEGSYRLDVTPYAEVRAGGSTGTTHSIAFNFFGQSSNAAQTEIKLATPELDTEQLFAENMLRIFPNPFTEDHITLSFGMELPENTQLLIVNQQGKIVYHTELYLNEENKVELNLKTITAKGSYYLKIFTQDKTLITKKIIKH